MPRRIIAQSQSVGKDKPEIPVKSDMLEQEQRAWEAVLKWNSKENVLYRKNGRVNIIHSSERRPPVIRQIYRNRMQNILAQSARWKEGAWRGGRYVYPPRQLALDMVNNANESLPVLNIVYPYPVVMYGKLLEQPGYYPELGIYLSIPEELVVTGKQYAMSLLYDVLHDFPFATDSDKANAIALLLTPFVRQYCETAPLFLITKPKPGSGAGLLADIFALLVTGYKPVIIPPPRGEGDWSRTLHATLSDMPPIVHIDNIKDIMGSASLSSMLTASPEWTLGRFTQSEGASVSTLHTTWVASANNPRLEPDIARRTARIRLTPKEEQPSMRKPESFKHFPLDTYVTSNRALLMSACLELIRQWLKAKCPMPQNRVSFGGFQKWADVLGGILEYAGVNGFLNNLGEFIDQSDTLRPAEIDFVRSWYAEFKNIPMKTGQLVKLAIESGVIVEYGTERSQSTRLGEILHNMEDKVFPLLNSRRVQVVKLGNAGQSKHSLKLIEHSTLLTLG